MTTKPTQNPTTPVVTSNEVNETVNQSVTNNEPKEETTQTDVKGFTKSTGKETVLEVKSTDTLKKDLVGDNGYSPTISGEIAVIQAAKHLLKITGFVATEVYQFWTYGSYVQALIRGEANGGFQKVNSLSEALTSLGLPKVAIEYFGLTGIFTPIENSSIPSLKLAGFTETEARKLTGCSARSAQDVYRPSEDVYEFTINLKGVPSKAVIKLPKGTETLLKTRKKETLQAAATAENMKVSEFVASLGGTIAPIENDLLECE